MNKIVEQFEEMKEILEEKPYLMNAMKELSTLNEYQIQRIRAIIAGMTGTYI